MACPVIATWSGVGLGGDLEPRLLRRSGEAALDALLHARDQDRVAEVLPAGLRVVNGEDGPAVGGRPGGVVGLAGGQRAVAGVHGRERGLVLLPGPALELVDDGVAHAWPPPAGRRSRGPRRRSRRPRRRPRTAGRPRGHRRRARRRGWRRAWGWS